MKTKTVFPLVVALASFVWLSAYAGQKTTQPANSDAPTAEEARAKAEYEAAEKAAREAEAALAPLRAAMQKADKAYAQGREVANAKRQRANESRRLAGEEGVEELKRAEANLAAAIKELEAAAKAKPPLDKALEEAKAAAAPLQQAYEAAEKAAREAEAKAKAAYDAAHKLEIEAKTAETRATVLRRAADAAKNALARVQQLQQTFAKQAEAAAQKVAEAEREKKAADAALAAAKQKVADATQAYQQAGKAAREAAARAKQVSADPAKSDAEKKQANAEAAAKRRAADKAKADLTQAQAALENAKKLADAAAQKLARATAQKKMADAALANIKKQAAAAAKAAETAEKAAQEAAKVAERKKQAAAEAAAKRKAAADAAAALAEARKAEQQAQARVNKATKKLAAAEKEKKAAEAALARAKKKLTDAARAYQQAQKAAQEAAARAKQVSADQAKSDAEKKQAADQAAAKQKAADEAKAALTKAQEAEKAAQARVAAATQNLKKAQAQKTAVDQALAAAKQRVAAATAALQAAQEAAKDLLALDAAAKQAAAEAAAKRKLANQAKADLAPKQKKLEQAVIQANAAARRLSRAEARKKSAEKFLENLKKRIAAAKKSYLDDEKAAQEAEKAVEPLKEQAEKTRAAYLAARKVAEEKRALAEQAKARYYRLVAAREVPKILESPEPARPSNRIDELVFAKLKALGIQPVLCSDAVFVRRAYLDITGKLPTAEEARAFIQSRDKNKRVALVERLLNQPAHADYWAMKWADILRIRAEYPVKLWPNAAQAYHRWIWESIAHNKPYDQFARELLTSSGSNFRVGPVNFYRAIQNRTPEGIAAAVGLALMGTRIDFWTEERRANMAVFFSQVGYKPTAEWKEEIVFWDPLKSVEVPGSIAPGQDSVAKSVAVTNQIPQALPKPINDNGSITAVFPDGTKVTIPPNRDPREVFADWLIRPDNPWFTKAIVNRTWAWIMGRGIIHEPDDIRDDNPPSNPELLAYLEKELVASHYDLKHLKRLIFTSTTYQLSSIPRFNSPEAKANFASYLLRRVEAEVLADIINEVTGSSDLYTSPVPEPFTYIPKDMPAVAIGDGSITSTFLTLFGRSARATGLESERVNELASPQWLYLLNSGQIQSKLQNGPKLRAIISSGGKPEQIVEKLYLTILSRFPTEGEVQAALDYAKSRVVRGRDVWIDLAWALINSPEFLLRH